MLTKLRQSPKVMQAATGAVSLGLRLASLAGKLILSLYMGKVFALRELGLYGLAFSAVMLAIVLLGFRIDYVVSREIASFDEERQRRVGAAAAVLFAGSFLVAAPLAVGALWLSGVGASTTFIALLLALCGIEAYANYLYTVTISLKRPALANALFFIRSGLWTFPAMLVSWLSPDLRTVEFILGCWLAGTSASVALNLVVLRRQLIGPLRPGGFDWAEIRHATSTGLMIWLGSVAVTLGAYIDRYVLAGALSLDDVGVATFYGSFTSAVLTLVQSATTTITLPSLIAHFDGRAMAPFRREMARTERMAALLCLIILFGLALAMWLIIGLLGKAQLVSAYPIFLLLLLATLIRTHAETLYTGLFVVRAHRAIWVGNVAFLLVSIAANFLLIPRLGLYGFGLANIVAAIALMSWRWVMFSHQARRSP
jgi:O-antigen/teichoic acid export membrane protein